jgi:membrane fusion protein (multidrug efflux system)
LVANEATEIHPEVAGRITGIFFKEGAYVPKGALLVKLYDADLQAQKQKLLVQIRIAEQNQNRSAQLLKIGGISRQDYENTELTTSNARADLEVLNTSILKTEIRAPFSGKLGLRMVSLGAYVNNATVITTISQMNQMRIDFTVPEKYTSQVKNGDIVNFTVPGSARNYAAKVIATESNISQNTRTLQVRAAVLGNQADLVPGGFAKVALNFQPDPNSIVVPSQAIIPEARGKKIFIYSGGIAKYVDVTTGLRDSVNVQVTSGVKAGDTVLVSGLMALKPNAKVKIGRIINSPRPAAP